jgi:hypothetical protein
MGQCTDGTGDSRSAKELETRETGRGNGTAAKQEMDCGKAVARVASIRQARYAHSVRFFGAGLPL